MKKTINKALSWLLSVVMFFGLFVAANVSKMEVGAAQIFYWPLDTNHKITTGFYGYKDHNGCDMACASGTPIYATFAGTAVYYQKYTMINGVKTLTSFGNCVYLTSHDQKYVAIYAHMNAFEGFSLQIPSTTTKQQSGSSGTITIGSKTVSEGDVLGYVGKTGNATGNHLHYGLKVNGNFVDPSSYLNHSMSTKDHGHSQPPHADIGTDFVATINEVKANKPLKAVNGNIQIGSSNGNADEKWWFIKQSDGSYIIESMINNNYITTGGTGNGSNVTTSKYTGSDSQKWYLYSVNGNYELAPKNSTDQRMNVAGGGTGDGTNIITWQAMSGSTDVQFKINKCGTKYIYNLGTDFVATINDVKGGKPFKAASNGNVELITSKGNIDEKWWFIRQADGTYIIESLYNNNYITSSGTGNGSNVSRLFQYLSGWNVIVNEAALDVNGDGSVNNKDVTRLFQYVSGWNVDIY